MLRITGNRINHLRVTAPTSVDPLVVKVHLSTLLGRVDFRPPELPSGAVLVIRSLHAEMPSCGSHIARADWEAALRGQMADLYRAAARPALGPVGAQAPSVLFVDRAEMLACLTRDLTSGQARQRWYWDHLLSRTVSLSTSAILADIWSDEAAVLPAALALLTHSEVYAAAALLSPREVGQIVLALHTCFRLPSDVLSLKIPDPATSGAQGRDSSGVLPAGFDSLNDADAPVPPGDSGPLAQSVQRPEPPWRPWLRTPAPTSQVSPQAEYLVGLGLWLWYMPTLARSRTFADQAVCWLRAALNPDAPSPGREQGRYLDHQRHADQARAGQTSAPLPGEFAPRTEMPSSHSAHAGKQNARAPHQHQTTSYSDEPDMALGADVSIAADGVWTGLGGILYLINVLEHLELSRVWGDSLGLWALVEALARSLLGPALAHDEHDPIWAVLADLDRRPAGSLLGAGLPEQTAFRLPARRLRQIGARQAWIAASDGASLRLASESTGCLIVECPLEGQSAEIAVRREIEAYQAAALEVIWRWGAVPELASLDPLAAGGLAPPLARWLEKVLGFIQVWLAAALGEPDLGAAQLADSLLRKQGMLSVGRTHIDLYLAMDQISLPIRRVGLDRDPGWAPDLGYIVQFHFH